MMQKRTGIVFPKRKKVLMSIFGDYLGSELHRIITSSRQFDRKLGIPLKPYHTFIIMDKTLLVTG